MRTGHRTRHFLHGETAWELHIQDTTSVPGARRDSCLICASGEVVRRRWDYPANWYELEDARLLQLCEEADPI